MTVRHQSKRSPVFSRTASDTCFAAREVARPTALGLFRAKRNSLKSKLPGELAAITTDVGTKCPAAIQLCTEFSELLQAGQ